MTVYAFNEANGTQVATITSTSLSGGGLGGAASDVQTNGSGQAINTNDFTTIGLFKTGSNRSRITLTTGYTGGLTSYVTPQIAVDGSNSGYVALLQLDTGTTYNRVQFQEDGAFFSAPFLTTPLDISAGVVELDLYLNGTTLTLDIYQSSVLHEQVTAASANLARQGSGVVWAYQGTQEQVEAWDDNLAGDVTPPVLTLPTGVETGDTTASGTVTTDEGNGTLYYYASTNSSETAATIKASGSSQAVSTSGSQNVSFTGLTASTTYYAHYVQDDTSANESNVVSSTSFTTDPPARTITNIDGDDNVQAGQTNVTITTANLDASPSTQIATLGGETLTINSWTASAVSVDIPLHIDLEWGSTANQLALTDDTGTTTLSNVTLSTPTGWETVTYNGTPPDAGTTESFYEYAQTDAGVGNFTMAANDILAWETQTGLSVDVQTIPIVAPPATVTGDYKIWDDSLSTWTSVSQFTITDGGDFDTTAPILSSPTGTKTGTTTADGTVSTDEGNGTLYYYASTNSSETAATIKASGSSQAVSVTGVQNVSFTSLTPATTYYAHYVHDDQATNESNVVSSVSFTTDAGDTTAPILSSPTAVATDQTTADGTVTTDEAGGTLYYYTSQNAGELASTVVASGQTQAVASSGVQNVSVTGLTAETSYYIHYVHTDASANQSAVVSSGQFTTDAVPDTTPPVLSSPTGAKNGSFAATGTVSTDEANGILYYIATENASETAATIKAGTDNQPVTATGAQNVSISGLSQNTTYYIHYVHDDAASNESNVVSSASFTTDPSTGGGFVSYKAWMESLPAGSFTTKLRVFLEGKGYSGTTTRMLYEYLKTVSSKNNHQERKNDWEDGGWN